MHCVIRCLPEQHAENKQVSVLVHTALGPAEGFVAKDRAAHRPGQQHLAFKKGFHAVDEQQKPVKDGSSTSRQGSSSNIKLSHHNPCHTCLTSKPHLPCTVCKATVSIQ